MSDTRVIPDPNPERVAEVVAAYKKLGMVPVSRFWKVGEECCGMGALCLVSGKPQGTAFRVFAYQAFGEHYVDGFTAGFDGEKGLLLRSDDALQGYADGRAAAKAVGLV